MRRPGAGPVEPSAGPGHVAIGGTLIAGTLDGIGEIVPRRGAAAGLDGAIPMRARGGPSPAEA